MNKASYLDMTFDIHDIKTPLQFICWYPSDDLEDYISLWRKALERSLLSRQLVYSRFPLVTPAWNVSTTYNDTSRSDHNLNGAELKRWLDRLCGDEDISATRGRAWKLATNSLKDGGFVICLTVSHTVADGRAVLEALNGIGHTHALNASHESRRETIVRLPLSSDLIDTLKKGAGIRLMIARDRFTGFGSRTLLRAAYDRFMTLVHRRGDSIRTPQSRSIEWTVIECPTKTLKDRATQHYGSTNSLLTAVLLNAARTTLPNTTFDIQAPVDKSRAAPDRRPNSLAMANFSFPASCPRLDDLQLVRAMTRHAFQNTRHFTEGSDSRDGVSLLFSDVGEVSSDLEKKLPAEQAPVFRSMLVGNWPPGFGINAQISIIVTKFSEVTSIYLTYFSDDHRLSECAKNFINECDLWGIPTMVKL